MSCGGFQGLSMTSRGSRPRRLSGSELHDKGAERRLCCLWLASVSKAGYFQDDRVRARPPDFVQSMDRLADRCAEAAAGEHDGPGCQRGFLMRGALLGIQRRLGPMRAGSLYARAGHAGTVRQGIGCRRCLRSRCADAGHDHAAASSRRPDAAPLPIKAKRLPHAWLAS